MIIDSFTTDYRFLSNFYPVEILYQGLVYKSVEAAYQSSKTFSREERVMFTTCTAAKSKELGRKLKLRQDFDDVKIKIMEEILKIKFSKEPFRGKLLLTRNYQIIEGNHWHDNFWGSCSCEKCGNKGENNLGKLLMKIRDEIT